MAPRTGDVEMTYHKKQKSPRRKKRRGNEEKEREGKEESNVEAEAREERERTFSFTEKAQHLLPWVPRWG